MFFAKIFSYAQRRKLCALAFDSTRDYLREHAPRLAPLLARHGLRLRSERIADQAREVTDAVTDPRPLHPGTSRRRSLRRIGRDLDHTLTQLEREIETLRAARRGTRAA
jgi:hypothetical protein